MAGNCVSLVTYRNKWHQNFDVWIKGVILLPKWGINRFNIWGTIHPLKEVWFIRWFLQICVLGKMKTMAYSYPYLTIKALFLYICNSYCYANVTFFFSILNSISPLPFHLKMTCYFDKVVESLSGGSFLLSFISQQNPLFLLFTSFFSCFPILGVSRFVILDSNM